MRSTAQNAPNPPAAPNPLAAPNAPATAGCPASAADLPPQALYGRWEARFDGEPAPATLQLGRNPDYAGSVRGTVVRGGATAQLAGDIDDDGQLTLDESQDGRAISATWTADLQPGSCGREFKGTWRNTSDDRTRSVVLRKTGD